ncbi:hypothetical protein NBT05_04550 [Aquimarina sp. ERC-38]|uniref:hypothetical protein n=1 Tax=Aquimarina sp. ERC-38 TaxID=2949996 RepID=UPI002245F937|nr:hypothetical protein [Aquimarina sp. ERC-38]UZO81740.1 hypothetical protein NBT05_04550 [Aquimarina sp. ERC-38]
MKKKLEAELVSIAHRLLQIKDKSDTESLLAETRKLYETLTILHFSEQHFKGPQPTLGSVYEALEHKNQETIATISETTEVDTIIVETSEEPETPYTKAETEPILELSREEKKVEVESKPIEELLEDTSKETIKESITIEDAHDKPEVKTEEIPEEKETRPEFVIENINEKISEDLFVPATAVFNKNDALTTTGFIKNDMQDIGGYTNATATNKPKSLNDQLKKSIQIGLNDRLAFIKHLFDNSTSDYNRVLSQLNTKHSKGEAFAFVNEMVKPDYRQWKGKEEYEQRFMDIIANRFEA